MNLRFLCLLSIAQTVVSFVSAQYGGGVYDFGQGRAGEKRGDWTPTDWLAVTLLLMVICVGLAISVGLCYYVNRREKRNTYGSRQLVARI